MKRKGKTANRVVGLILMTPLFAFIAFIAKEQVARAQCGGFYEDFMAYKSISRTEKQSLYDELDVSNCDRERKLRALTNAAYYETSDSYGEQIAKQFFKLIKDDGIPSEKRDEYMFFMRLNSNNSYLKENLAPWLEEALYKPGYLACRPISTLPESQRESLQGYERAYAAFCQQYTNLYQSQSKEQRENALNEMGRILGIYNGHQGWGHGSYELLYLYTDAPKIGRHGMNPNLSYRLNEPKVETIKVHVLPHIIKRNINFLILNDLNNRAIAKDKINREKGVKRGWYNDIKTWPTEAELEITKALAKGDAKLSKLTFVNNINGGYHRFLYYYGKRRGPHPIFEATIDLAKSNPKITKNYDIFETKYVQPNNRSWAIAAGNVLSEFAIHTDDKKVRNEIINVLDDSLGKKYQSLTVENLFKIYFNGKIDSKTLQNILQKHPNNQMAHVALGVLTLTQAKDYKQLADYYRTAFQQVRNETTEYYTLLSLLMGTLFSSDEADVALFYPVFFDLYARRDAQQYFTWYPQKYPESIRRMVPLAMLGLYKSYEKENPHLGDTFEFFYTAASKSPEDANYVIQYLTNTLQTTNYLHQEKTEELLGHLLKAYPNEEIK